MRTCFEGRSDSTDAVRMVPGVCCSAYKMVQSERCLQCGTSRPRSRWLLVQFVSRSVIGLRYHGLLPSANRSKRSGRAAQSEVGITHSSRARMPLVARRLKHGTAPLSALWFLAYSAGMRKVAVVFRDSPTAKGFADARVGVYR